MANTEEKSEQARRVLIIYNLFLRDIKLTSNVVLEKINEEFGDVSKRSVQRDLQVLKDSDYIQSENKGRNSFWRLNRGKKITLPTQIKTSELLSFYILKAYLKTFKGTEIENDINSLTAKIESLAPGDAILEDALYWDQNPGFYNYQYKHKIISKLLNYINEKTWVKMEYEKMWDEGIVRSYDIFPESFFTYGGTIYLIGYLSKHKAFLNFAVQNIINLEESSYQSRKYPEFDYEKFRQARFAVMDGELSDVVLKIRKDFAVYFENRTWHPSQKVTSDKTGNMILRLKVPLQPDFISWILRWTEAITVVSPESLKQRLRKIYEEAIGK
ncbi:MAG: WYL domain-containing protein [Bacteroidetes bacterium]|nr:MAG: WYL domain-containing protein [Bacteroidota bacterium]